MRLGIAPTGHASLWEPDVVADEIGQFGVQVLQKLESIVHKEHLQGSGSLSGGTQSTNMVREIRRSPSATQLAA